MNDLVVPVSVVELDLDELDLRMLVQHLYEKLRSAVIREAQVLYLALFPLPDAPVEAVVLYLCIVIISVFNAVKKIKIEVINAASFELLIKDLVPVLERMDRPCGKLCGDRK